MQIPPEVPEKADSARQAEKRVVVTRLPRPGECGSQVVVLVVHHTEHCRVAGLDEGTRAFGQLQEEAGVAIPGSRLLTALAQSLQGELPDRCQRRIARLAVLLLNLHEACVQKCRHPVQDIEWLIKLGDRLGGFQGGATRKDAEATKEGPLVRLQ